MSESKNDSVGDFPYLDPNKIDESFVKPSYREGQKACIEFAVKAFNDGKKIVILECPTGSGKSTIGMTIGSMVYDSYYLTITKILQDQLVGDFDDIIDLKGRNAYPCNYYDRFGKVLVSKSLMTKKELNDKTSKKPDCASGFCRTSLHKSVDPTAKDHRCNRCFLGQPPIQKSYKALTKIPPGELTVLPENMFYCACPYYERVYQAIDSRKVVMNFSSFIFQTSFTQRFTVPRDLLIIDEGHNIEPQLLEFVSLTINDNILQNHNITMPRYNTAAEYAKWFEEINLINLIDELIELAETNEKPKEADELEKLKSKYEIFKKHVSKNGAEWVVEFTSKSERGRNYRSLVLKPVYAVDFAHDLLFQYGKRVLIMSATILDVDVICRSLGLDRKDVAAYRMKNRFPVENRPIFIKPAARMTGGKDKMAEWMPKLVKSVDEIVEKYKDKRGIIHTHNFAIMEALLASSKKSVARRFITQKEFSDKKHLLEVHASRPDSIIVAPAMHEGIDLIDDLSRFQIICKVPYANCYDNQQLARRVEVDPKYYTWITALKLVQSYGRSVRSETDFADTFIIDETIYKFLRDASKMLPSWFTEAIIK